MIYLQDAFVSFFAGDVLYIALVVGILFLVAMSFVVALEIIDRKDTQR